MDRRNLTLGAVALVALLVVFGILAAQPPEAAAQTNFIHGAATGCAQCHHTTTFDAGFRPCGDCHDPSFAQAACTQCHTGYTTTGATCWSCHIPAEGAPPHADTSCRRCHAAEPHLGSSPACTTCHTEVAAASPHHDAVDQQAPTQCTDCHTGQESHGIRTCTTCHAASPHPNIPEVPGVCNRCHEETVFNGRGDCRSCHSASGGFAGFTDEDIHDNTLPDEPIGIRGCTTCHPGKERHSAQHVDCVQCHTRAPAFHHGTAPDTGVKACADCHGQKQQHGTGLACTTCHVGVQHLENPLSVTPIGGCRTCHPPAEKGTKNCFTCHRLPIYHVTPSVGGCSSCHGSGRASHAGVVSCTKCHTNIDRGHHITSVVRPACTTAGCHTTFEQHQPGVKCTDCHGRGAVHDSTPRNLPADTWSVCARCHSFVRAGLAAGLPACSQCHDATQHNADYRVPACSACHDQVKHAEKVDCRLCHTNLDKGHHRAGEVSTRACSSCHVGAAIHASGTTAGAAFTCGTCHEGSVHGKLGLPAPKDCIACHEKAPDHAGDFACIECHWPAAHSARPDAAIFGNYTPLAIDLPTIPSSGEDSQADGRGSFTGTGFQMLAALAVAAVLIGTGVFLRRRKP